MDYSFQSWLNSSINRLDEAYAADGIGGWSSYLAGRIAAEAGDMAARLGLAELHATSRKLKAAADVQAVKTFLSQCIAACPIPPAAALLSVDETATIMGVSPSHIYRLADSGKMPRPVKIGSLVRWVRAELESWIATGCKGKRNGQRIS